MYTESLTQIGGILAGIAVFLWEYLREFGHFKIAKNPSFFWNSTKAQASA